MPALSADEATQFMTELLAIWTEPDRELRRAAIASHYSDDIVFHDPDGVFTGHAELESFSDSLQQRFPGARFQMDGEPTVVDDAVRAFWTFGPVTGMDFAILADGKVKTLYAFVQRPGGH